MSPLTRTLLTLVFLTAAHGAHAVPVSNGPTPVLMEAPDLDGDGQPDSFGAAAFNTLSQSGAAAHRNGTISPIEAPAPKGWLLAFAVVFGVAALNRKMR